MTPWGRKTVWTKTNLLVGCALLAVGALLGCAPVAAPKPNIEHMLATAKTASDHEAIAQYYEQEAADDEVKYEEHKGSAVQYEHSVKYRGWGRHCDRLAQDYKQAHQNASVLAAEHRKVADEISASSGAPAAPSGATPPAKQNP